jgi:hypothetical protein
VKPKSEQDQVRPEKQEVTFLLRIPNDLWERFVKTVPISRTRHDFILDLIQRRVWEYEKATNHV